MSPDPRALTRRAAEVRRDAAAAAALHDLAREGAERLSAELDAFLAFLWRARARPAFLWRARAHLTRYSTTPPPLAQQVPGAPIIAPGS